MTTRRSRAWALLDGAVDGVCTISCIAIVLISFVAVVFRYVFNNSLTWSEELTRYMFIWIVFLGAAVSVRQRANIAIDLFGGRVGPVGQRLLDVIERVATIAFALLVVIPGFAFVRIGMSNLSPALEIPMGVVYAAPVVGCGLMIVYVLRRAPVAASRDNLTV
jgi:TRAP-type C4-dicarboxylate transport system permease small subunit